jgi:hypothetical protein
MVHHKKVAIPRSNHTAGAVLNQRSGVEVVAPNAEGVPVLGSEGRDLTGEALLATKKQQPWRID